jgi:hypothetical protein
MALYGLDMSRRVPRLPRKGGPVASAAHATTATGLSSRTGGPNKGVRALTAVPAVCNDASVADAGTRTRLISDICSLLHEPAIPESARSAGLELIGWLARRMPGEAAHALGVEEATLAKRASRRKAR